MGCSRIMTHYIIHLACGQRICSQHFDEHCAKWCPAKPPPPPKTAPKYDRDLAEWMWYRR